MNPTLDARAWTLLLTLSGVWGGSFIFNRFALNDFEPLTVVMGRVAIAAVALHVVLRLRGINVPTSGREWSEWLVMGVLNNVIPFTLIVWGQTRISSGLASILNATTPLFAVTLAHFLSRDERITVNRFTGVLLGIAGVVALVGLDATGGSGGDTWGKIACLGASASYALAGLWGRRLGSNAPVLNATGQVTCSAAIMAVLALAIDRPWHMTNPAPSSLLAVLGLGILCTAVGYLLYFGLLARAGATNTLLVTLIIPVSALFLSWLLLDESVGPADLAGMTLIATGLLAIDGRLVTLIRARMVQSRASSASVRS